ncbi:MAG: hypothetical protein WD928_00495 [Gammaproteobacteria bacterium]
MLALLDQWAQRGWIRDVDLALTRMLARLSPVVESSLGTGSGRDSSAATGRSGEADDGSGSGSGRGADSGTDLDAGRVNGPALALLACALVSHQASRGHLLLNLDQALTDPDALITTQDAHAAAAPGDLVTPARLLGGVSAEAWRAAIAEWPRSGDGSAAKPLVLQGRDLYLYRFWALERAITRQVEDRLLYPVELDAGAVRALLDPLFPDGSGPTDGSTDWQRIACACAARARFPLITGGPGTGKTTTVIRLLALVEHAETAALDHGAGDLAEGIEFDDTRRAGEDANAARELGAAGGMVARQGLEAPAQRSQRLGQ